MSWGKSYRGLQIKINNMDKQTFSRIAKFANDKFPDASAAEHAEKLMEEVEEFCDEVVFFEKEIMPFGNELEEAADVQITLIGALSKMGYKYEDFTKALNEKLTIVENSKFIEREGAWKRQK